jgi:NADPH-dependent curcumin reductase
MTYQSARSIVLKSRPVGEPVDANFSIMETAIPPIGEGQVLVETLWLSLDPYMREHMNVGTPDAPGVEIGQPMRADTVGRILHSRDPGMVLGDIVTGYTFWQTHTVCDANELRKLDPHIAPPRTALSILGMTGMTAYMGLLRIGKPTSGETVVVAAATGPVGSVVAQIARRQGCRVVGIAGGVDKCSYLLEQLSLDGAVNHHDPDLKRLLAEACPAGIDVYFENVGGRVWQAVLPLLNNFARVPVCGQIAHYSDIGTPPGPNQMPAMMETILDRRLMLQGFMVFDFEAEADSFRAEMAEWLRSGEIINLEDITDGLDHAPSRFVGMLKGHNFGKTLIRVAAD